MLHILYGITAIIFGVMAIIAAKKKYLQYQLGTFAATIVSGVVLVFMQPSTLTHLCVSGTVFTALSIVLYVGARRSIAVHNS